MKKIALFVLSFLILLLVLRLVACSDPFIGIPGGELQGTLTEVPASWGEVPDTIQFETRPSDPYSINIWAVVVDGDLYVATKEANWVPFIAADPRVRVRIDGKLYELTATRTVSDEDMVALTAAYSAKYDYAFTDDEGDEAQAFRLTAR
ncbi:MAG: hypothetical protein ACR2PJ_06355 [Pseudomonadales bacterium]